jgi:hypothetical protein
MNPAIASAMYREVRVPREDRSPERPMYREVRVPREDTTTGMQEVGYQK